MPSLETKEGKFFLNGQETVLLSGAMHYFRIHPEYWKDRLRRLKACGLNCVETYVPWNAHEPIPGEFNFDGILDLRRYIQMAHQLGLYVLLRPGPYICAEWEFGGLPSWLLRDPGMKVRSSYKPYIDAVDRYLAKVFSIVKDLQMTNGGPIIAFQLENEYGSYDDDLEYKEFLKETYRKCGVEELLFTSDNGTGIFKGEVPGELVTANFQEQEHGYLMFEYLKNVKQPGKPLMVMEFWSGWFDHWGEKHHIWPLEEFERVLKWILEQESSVNFYMFHGGTNFGFMAGANEGLGATNEGNLNPYMSDVTSYDYDAPVAENGDLTPKFHKIRDVIKRVLPNQVQHFPDPPESIPSAAYGEMTVMSHMKFEDIIAHVNPLKSNRVVTMEQLDINKGAGQSYGFTLYRSKVERVSAVKLMGTVKDRAIIYANGLEKGVVDFSQKNSVTSLNTEEDVNTLDILVENMGRVNYAEFKTPVLNDQRKGLREDVFVDTRKIDSWEIFPLEFKEDFVNRLSKGSSWQPGLPQEEGSPHAFLVKLSILNEPQDTYINMRHWNKGVVFVNGFNIGRYWNKGPQNTLFIPAPLFKYGDNEIVIFELHKPYKSVTFEDKPDLGDPIIHKTDIPRSFKALLFALKNSLRLGPWVWNIWKQFIR